MRYRAIQEHDRRVPVRLMCRALAVSPAGYYAWADRPESDRSVRNRALLSAIRVVHRESRETSSEGTGLVSTASRGSCASKGSGPRP